MKKVRKLFFYLLLMLSFNTLNALDRITINQSNFSKVKIAINFDLETNNICTSFVQDLYKIVSDDLSSSNLFEALNPQLFIEQKYGVEHIPNFASWKTISANLLLNLSLKKQSHNMLDVSFVLWDIILKKIVIKKMHIASNIHTLRQLGHFISDMVYEYSTGYEGYFNSKILYVAEYGKYKNRIKKIAIMDYDGHNHENLTDGSSIVSSPRFFPDGKKILYVTYKNKIPSLVIMDLANKKSEIISNINNISFAPEISPNGEEIIFSIAKNGQTHIYEYNIISKALKQLTFGDHINTSPCYSPCSKYIIFNSNRANKRDLFVLRRSDSKVFKLTKSSGTYAEPKWSVKNWITFTKIHKTLGFTIGVFNIEDKNLLLSERIIATAYLVESPVWSKNGRMLLFTKGFRLNNKVKHAKYLEYNIKNLNKLYMIDAFGICGEKIVPTPEDASDADWSKSFYHYSK